MNIAVINIKDIIKYAIKIGTLLLLIYIGVQIFKIQDKPEENVISKSMQNSISKIENSSLINCLDIVIPLMSYNKNNTKEINILTNDKILAMGAGILDKSILDDTDLVINEDELTQDDIEELANQYTQISKDAKTEEVSENNIKAKYTTSYESVQINNQSKYELTEKMLTPDVDINNKKDVLIYHTHTCESYTPSKRL